MHADINNCVSSLSDLFSNDIVIQGSFCWEDNYLFLLRYLLVTSCLRDLVWETGSGVSGWCLLRPCKHISHNLNGWFDSITWRWLHVCARLPFLNKGSLDVPISVRSSLIEGTTSCSRSPESIASRGLFLRTWLEEKVVDDHLSLIHVNWRDRLRTIISSLCSRSCSLLEHITLLLFQKLHVFLRRLMRHVTKCIYDWLSLVELFLSLALINHIHCRRSRPWLISLIW